MLAMLPRMWISWKLHSLRQFVLQVAILDKFSEAIRGDLQTVEREKLAALVTVEVGILLCVCVCVCVCVCARAQACCGD